MKLMKRFMAMLVFVACALTTFAQQMPPIPVDPQVRIGKLDNGLTYYIRQNNYPEGQANFYIAQKVGSVLEEDNQRGLASSSTCVSMVQRSSPAMVLSSILRASA